MSNCFTVPIPKPECTSDSDCANDKACINEVCKNPCSEYSSCAPTAECRVQMHRPTCSCRDGQTGNAQNHCFESKYFH